MSEYTSYVTLKFTQVLATVHINLLPFTLKFVYDISSKCRFCMLETASVTIV